MNWVDAWGLSASDGGRTAKPTVSSITGNFFLGIWDAGVSTVKGVFHIVRHPIETATALVHVVKHPIETGEAIWEFGSTTVKTFIEGDANVKARMSGRVIGEIGLAVLTSKGIDKAAKTLKSSKFLKGTAKGLGKNADDVGVVGAKGSKVNLANASCTKHILYGDATGGGHKWGLSRLFNGKTKFPMRWSDKKIMHYVSDIATDPSLNPVWTKGKYGSLFTRAGEPSRFYVDGIRDGVKIHVVIEPATDSIITAFPIR